MAVAIWNTMGGTIDWEGLGILMEMFDVDDEDLVLESLLQIKARAR